MRCYLLIVLAAVSCFKKHTKQSSHLQQCASEQVLKLSLGQGPKFTGIKGTAYSKKANISYTKNLCASLITIDNSNIDFVSTDDVVVRFSSMDGTKIWPCKDTINTLADSTHFWYRIGQSFWLPTLQFCDGTMMSNKALKVYTQALGKKNSKIDYQITKVPEHSCSSSQLATITNQLSSLLKTQGQVHKEVEAIQALTKSANTIYQITNTIPNIAKQQQLFVGAQICSSYAYSSKLML